MSSKFMYDLRDDHPQLQRQLGCMTGIFQIFDRRYLLSGSRRLGSQSQKQLPSSGHRKDNGTAAAKYAAQNSKEQRGVKKGIKEVHRSCTESSVTSSSSSSCSSSFHSVDCARGYQAEVYSQKGHHKSHHDEQRRVVSNRAKTGDFRDFVADSIHRETRVIAVKADREGNFETIPLNFIDSPRPFPRKNLKSASCKETLRELHQIHNSHGGFVDKPLDSSIKDVRRYSFDGRTSHRVKAKELPRFSLDSRANTKNASFETGRNYVTQDLWRNGSSNLLQEPVNLKRQSSVVAKLMGLEAAPDPVRTSCEKSYVKDGVDHQSNSVARSNRVDDENYRSRTACSPRNLQGSPSSARVGELAPDQKHHARSKSLNELASWNQVDESSGPQSATRPRKAVNGDSIKQDSVKNIGHLNVQDLRAIEQLLEAMKKNEETVEARSDASRSFNHLSKLKFLNLGLDYQKIGAEAKSPAPRSSSPETLRSPIVVMKSTTQVERPKLPESPRSRLDDERKINMAGSASLSRNRGKPVGNNSTSRTNEMKVSMNNQTRKNRPINSGNTKKDYGSTRENSVSGRRQASFRDIRSKEEVEKQVLPSTPSMVCNVTIRQSNRQITHINSPRRLRPKSLNMDETHVKFVEPVLDRVEDSVPLQSAEIPTTSIPVDEEFPWLSKPVCQENVREQDQFSRKTEELTLELPEQPSPVSVLDAKFCNEDLPSPIKKISTAFTELDACDVLDRTNPEACQTSSSGPDMETDDSKSIYYPQDSSDSSQITDIISVYEKSSMEHKYIVEIVATAGLLEGNDITCVATQLNPSIQSVKPRFFFALEEARARQGLPDEKGGKHYLKVAKTRRKLVFDVVDEILVRKMAPTYSFKMGRASNVLIQEMPKGMPLLQELFCEVDRLTSSQSTFNLDEDDRVTSLVLEDLRYQSENWMSGVAEVPSLVLDLERLIFKDLLRDEFLVEI